MSRLSSNLSQQGITSSAIIDELAVILDARTELAWLAAKRRAKEARQRESDDWYAAEVERMKERAPA